jgi:dihydrodipicolinate synthase/N-acetylneuraminate lyase
VPPYGPGEAREYAREHLRGVTGCLLPTFTSDLARPNERAMRHDVRREKELDIDGILLVAECGTTLDEMKLVTDVCVDEARGELFTVAHAGMQTLEQNVELVRYSESAGADYVLVPYPVLFYPRSEDDVFEYTRTIAEASSLGIIVFAMHTWGFRRLHPSHFSPDLIGRMIDEIPNVVAVKNEIGFPGLSGMAQVFERYRERVLVTDPIEANVPGWWASYGLRWIGTSNYEAYGDAVPRYFGLLQEGRYEEAMEIYWRIGPIREADFEIVTEAMRGSGLIPRLVWKYQGWLHGFNGGPIRPPHHRIYDRQMTALRRAVGLAGFEPASGDDADFFVGRNPA